MRYPTRVHAVCVHRFYPGNGWVEDHADYPFSSRLNELANRNPTGKIVFQTERRGEPLVTNKLQVQIGYEKSGQLISKLLLRGVRVQREVLLFQGWIARSRRHTTLQHEIPSTPSCGAAWVESALVADAGHFICSDAPEVGKTWT